MTTLFYANRQNLKTNAVPNPPELNYPARVVKSSLIKIVRAATRPVDERTLTYVISSNSRSILHPKPLLNLLCLCYARGIYASAEIEIALRSDEQLQQVCDKSIPDASELRRFRDDNWNSIRSCLATVLWCLAQQKIIEGFVTKANKASVNQEAIRRMTAAAFSDTECGWN